MRIPLYKKSLFLFVGAVMFVLALPPNQFGFLAWLALIPLILVLSDTQSIWQGITWSFAFGLFVNSYGFWWLIYPSGKGMFASILYLTLFWVLLGLLFCLIDRVKKGLAIYLFPFILVFIEFVRAYGRLGFPWHDLAYTQSYNNILIQFADITGTAGVSFFVASLNVLFLVFLRSLLTRVHKQTLIFGGLLIVMFLLPNTYGLYRIKQFSNQEAKLKVAILQGNVDPYHKWDRAFRHRNMEIYLEMIDSLVPTKPELIVMPESATAGYWRRKSTRFSLLQDISRDNKIPILTGTLDYNPDNRREFYNSAYYINPFGEDDVYFKMQLVPVSEQIPWQEKFEWLRKLDVGGSHFSRGSEYKIFDLPTADGDTAHFAVSICYESLFPEIIRKFRKQGANLILNITNDGWFKTSPGAWQNLQFNVFRAIENRVFIVRSANTGISAFVNPAGQVYSSLGLFQKGAIVKRVGLSSEKLTFYTEYGNFFGYFTLFLVPLLAIIGFFRKRR